MSQIKSIALAFLVAAGLSAAACAPAASPDQKSILVNRLREVDHVQFFLVARTGDYNYSEDELMNAASIRIFRKCGANCASFMEPVLEHLRESTERKCLQGQQDVLIQIDVETNVVYSYSGRQAKIGSRCYFNQRGIKEVLRTPWFLF
jgi:hypothetical protein